jgi:hypothetical protein
MREVAPGLHSWTAPHPEWDPDGEPGSSADWPEQVGCVLYEAPDAVALIDPLVPEALWPRLDGLVAGRPVAVLTTIRWHGRSRDAALARYGAAEDLPTGVEALRYPAFGETMYWLPEPRALVPGDNLIGDGAGGVRVCPQSWLDSGTVEELRDALQPLLELPVEHILTSHWEPVIGNGQAALARALS